MDKEKTDAIITKHTSWQSLRDDLKRMAKEVGEHNERKKLQNLPVDTLKPKISYLDIGHIFERLTQLLLQTLPEFTSTYKNVWWANNKREIPEEVITYLELPVKYGDEGIDLIAQTHDGDYHSVQSKFRSDKEKPFTKVDVDSFIALSKETCKNITRLLFFNTSQVPMKKRELTPSLSEFGLRTWGNLTQNQWNTIRNLCGANVDPENLVALKPHEYQKQVITKAAKFFQKEKQSRGRLIMPCGTGKSLIAFWIAERLEAQNIIVAVPSLALIRQSITVWLREYLWQACLFWPT